MTLDRRASEQFWALAEQAKTRGKDLAEVLDREGILLTAQRRLTIEADAIDRTADLIEQIPTISLLPSTRRPNTTPEDVKRGIIEILRTQAQGKRQP